MKNPQTTANKPYNKCLSCPHMDVRCDGPRTSAMSLARWCEYMRDWKNIKGYTNVYIAEQSGVSEKTVERLMALNADKDIMRETARLIEDVILGSSNQYPCYLAFEDDHPKHSQALADATRELERALADNKDYRKALDDIHVSYKAELKEIRDEAQRKIDYLLREVERARAEADAWKAENVRKSAMIDKNWDKIMQK